MPDTRAHLEKLRADAQDCADISRRATDARKRELFANLAEHLNRLALEVERELAKQEKRDALNESRAL